MTKEDFYSIVIYIIMAAIILVTAFAVIRPAMESGYLAINAGSNFLFLLCSLIIGIVLNVLLLEFGHAIGAKIGGYSILSLNILGFCFYKEEVEGKVKTSFKFKSFNGLSGETIISPKKDKSNPMFYVFIPLLLMLLQFVVLYCVLTFIKSSSAADKMLMYIKYGVIVDVTIAACFVVYNYFPARLDTLNDGYRLVLLNKKVNLEAYNLELKIEEAKFFNKEFNDYKTFDVITDFTARTNLDVALLKFMKKENDEALEIINNTLKEPKKMSRSTRDDILMNKAYIYFLSKPFEEAKAFFEETFTSNDKQVIQTCKTYTQIKLYILYAGLVEQSKSEIEFALNKKKKLDKQYSSGTSSVESEYITLSLNKVNETYPQLSIKQ